MNSIYVLLRTKKNHIVLQRDSEGEGAGERGKREKKKGGRKGKKGVMGRETERREQ